MHLPLSRFILLELLGIPERMAAFAVILSRVPLGGMSAVSSARITGNSSYGVVLAASLGRGSGGVHGYRSGKGRRRRSPGNESSDEAERQENKLQCKSNADGPPPESPVKSGNGQVRRLRKHVSKPREDNAPRSSVEVVAPVAGTILTAPEFFENHSQDSSSAASAAAVEDHDEADNSTGQNSDLGPESQETVVNDKACEKPEKPEKPDPESGSENSSLQHQVVEQMKQVVAQVGHKVVDDVLPEQVVQVAQVVEQAALPVVEKVATAAAQVKLLLVEQKEEDPSDDEFEAYATTDNPEFRGVRGLENFTVLQENSGIMTNIHDFYIYSLKKPMVEFALAMLASPVVVSMFFTLLYLPQIHGLAFGEAASYFGHSSGEGLTLSWETAFQVFMFSVSLSTGLQPELAPVSPYTLVVANINALVAQLLFVFLSGAVFARLSQPSQPIRCSTVAVVSPSTRRSSRVFMARYVLVGPQPCELVDVKVDLSYKYNTITRLGTYFRATQSLKLIRSEVAYLTHGMLVRHIIDESSPLVKRTPEMLKKEDGIFTLSVVGLERSSMQPVFHAQNYSMDDDQVVWNAEYEDMILISKKNMRIVDHSRLSQWRPV